MRKIEWGFTANVTHGTLDVRDDATREEIMREIKGEVLSRVDLTWEDVTPAPAPRWHNVREDGPPKEEDLTLYLVSYRLGCGGSHIGYALVYYGCERWTTPDHLIVTSVTHYLPVPPLPRPPDD